MSEAKSEASELSAEFGDDVDSFHCADCGLGWNAIDETERPREECPLCGSENTDVPAA